MSTAKNAAELLRLMSQRRGAKITARDAAVLVLAANALDALVAELDRHMDVGRQMLYQTVDAQMRADTLTQLLQAALEVTR